MSYSIIFDTKFIKLEDGRLLMLQRSGCNNDDVGRSLWDYVGKIYTYQELQQYISSLTDNNSQGFELKIENKNATYNDYRKYLAMRANKAKTYAEFKNERYFTANRFDGIDLKKPENKIISLEEFKKYLSGILPLQYSRILTELKSESEIIKSIEDNKPIEFYVGKKYKKVI